MKKILLIVSFMLSVLAVYSQTGIGTKIVDPSALMELQSTNKGFLPPRVKLLSGTDITTIPAPATGLTVYHTGIAGMPAGLYVNLGTSTSATWVNTSGSNWGLTGNAGTLPANNFIGTTDAVDFITRTNNTERMRLSSAGNLGIATPTPGTTLDVNGAITNRETLITVGGNAATIPANVSQVQLNGTATANIVVTAPAAPNNGQRLIIYNNTDGGFPALLNSIPVPAGQAMEFAYSNNGWRGTNGGATAITPNTYWSNNGNTATNASTNFIGTTDNVDFVTRTNNTEKMRVTAAGKVGIGTTTPNGLLSFSNNFSTERQIVLREYNGGTDDNQFAGLGVGPAGTVKLHITPLGTPLASLFRIQAAINATSTETLMDVYPDGSFNIGAARTTSIPATLLSVNGNTSVGGAIINLESPPIDVSTNTGTIPNNTSQVRLTGAATANITLTAPTAPINGQRLIIYNSTATFPALLNGIPVPAGQAMEFAYSAGAWRGTNGGAAAANLTWGINGNTGTSATNNFIGTTDNNAFVTRTNNTEKMRVTAAGNLGIGTTTPNSILDLGTTVGASVTDVLGKKLAVYNNAAGTDFYGLGINGSILQFHAASTQSKAPGMVLTAGGNVGIGTTAPGQILSVVDGLNSNQYNGIASFLANNLTYGVGIGYAGIQAIGTNPNNDLYINGKGTGNLILQAVNGATGKVGIGTTAPVAQLDVVGGGSTIGLRNANGSWDNIWLSVDPAGYYSYVNASGADSGLQFRVGSNSVGTYGNGQVLTTVATMMPNGNVGIGNTAPAVNLEIGSTTGPVNPTLRLHSSGNEFGSGAVIDFNENNTGYGTRIRHQTGPNAANTQVEGLYFNSLNNGTESANPILMIDQINNRVGIGTGAPDQALSINGNASKSGGGNWATFSDKRMKEDIHPFTDGLRQVMQINPVFYKYNGKGGVNPSKKEEIGIIAQEMQQIAPYTVTQTDRKIDDSGKGALQFDREGAVTYMLVNGMKEQQSQIETQKTENSELKKQLAAQQEILSNLLKKVASLEQAISTKK